VLLRKGASAAKNLLKWKIARGGHATAADVGDLVGGQLILGICLYDTSATPQPLLAAAVLSGGTCGSKPCWKSIAGGGYRYKNKTGGADGICDLKLRASGSGELALVAKGKGAVLPMPALELVPPVRLQLVVSNPGGTICWESSFTSALKNDGSVFKAN
jgi:hypothetical protein